MRQIETWSLTIKVNGKWRKSPEYSTPEEACSKIVPFLKKFPKQFTTVTVIRNVRYEQDEESQA